MILSKKIGYGLNLFKVRFLKKRFPLAVCWYLTYRCNYNCKYCGISGLDSGGEMSTAEVFSTIDDLKKLGTRRIHFCGGESLLREDMCDIIDYCKSCSIEVGLISNGSMISKYAERLSVLDELRLSLDGPAHIQDELRGEGAYDKLMEAVKSAKKEGIRTVFSTTLNKINLPFVGFIIEKSKELGIPVIFAPINYIHSGNKEIQDLLPPTKFYREKINYLIREAKRNKYIINSIPGLRYIFQYPYGKKINLCVGGRLFCHIKPNGGVYPCESIKLPDASNCRNEGMEVAFRRLSLVSCSQCWCSATLELNLVYSLNIRTIMNIMKRAV